MKNVYFAKFSFGYSTKYNCFSYINDQINSISIYYKIQNASCQFSEEDERRKYERGTTKTLGKN